MTSASETIKLIIRTANNKYADFNLELSSLATVYDLKEGIAANHPTRPIPKDQRLIFSGKLLEDSTVLHQIFVKSTSGASFMVHLVLDSDKNATTPKTPQPTTVQSPSIVPEQPRSSTNPTTISSHSSTYEQYSEELNKYQQQLQQFLTNPNGIPPMANHQTQAYLQYCYTHYHMYQNFLAYQRTVPHPSIANAIPVPQPTTTTTAPPPPPPAPAQPPPPPAAAAGNNNNNDFEQENDLLGILNMLVELFVLCSIIYFYSTFSRFLVVFLIFALLYLHCRGYLSLQRRRRAPVQPAPVVAEPAAGNDGEQAGGGDEETEADPVVNDPANLNDIQRPRPPPPPNPLGDNQISTSRVLLTAVTTFFSSLIPERPQRT